MKHTKTLLTCLVALALHNGAWAEQVYETKDAEGNPEFTDSPKLEDATQIDLQPTNTADAPQEQPEAQQEAPQQQPYPQDQMAPGQVPQQQNVEIIGNENGYDDDGYNNLEQGEVNRQRALEAADPETPHEVGDSLQQRPDEVGDSMGEIPDEVGDPIPTRDVDAAEAGMPEGVDHMQEEANRAYRH